MNKVKFIFAVFAQVQNRSLFQKRTGQLYYLKGIRLFDVKVFRLSDLKVSRLSDLKVIRLSDLKNIRLSALIVIRLSECYSLVYMSRHMSRLSSRIAYVQTCICPDYLAFIFFQTV